MKTSVLILLGCLLAWAAGDTFVGDKVDPVAAGMNPAALSRISARMKRFVDEGKAPGIVTLVARHGHVAALDAVGYQDLEKKIPMPVNAIFRTMSVSKPVTCAGIMTLVDQGELT